ncbi:MAG: hypothetical protein M1378_13460 [Bacteroidetes bacterium]|nr:hypothetical protein [Bacteroidota bacterium]
MKHEKKYYVILSLALITIGAAVIGFGIWYGYQVFHGGSVPPILEGKGGSAPAAATAGSGLGSAGNAAVLSAVGAIAGKLGDVVLQYIFAFLLFSGGGRIAKIGVSAAMIPYKAKKEEEKEEEKSK